MAWVCPFSITIDFAKSGVHSSISTRRLTLHLQIGNHLAKRVSVDTRSFARRQFSRTMNYCSPLLQEIRAFALRNGLLISQR